MEAVAADAAQRMHLEFSRAMGRGTAYWLLAATSAKLADCGVRCHALDTSCSWRASLQLRMRAEIHPPGTHFIAGKSLPAGDGSGIV